MTENKSKRTLAHNKADKAYTERLKESGIKPRKFLLDDTQAQCLRDVEAFIKLDGKNIKLILDHIGNR
jgi:hypothetical protein